METAPNPTTAKKVPVTQKNALLTDVCSVKLHLDESAEPGKKVVVRGEFARCGAPTENKRVYSRRLWEREIQRLSKPMAERQVLGEADHPTQSKTALSRASHILTNLWIENDVVMGEAEVMDTDSGRNVKAILASGAKIGVSSRGYGSVRTDMSGNDVVQDDYRLVTFDFVVDPANTTSYPEVFYEHKEDSMSDKDKAVEFAERITAARDETRQDVEVSLREEFSRDLLTQVAKAKAEIRESVRAELLADPEVAAAKNVLENIKALVRPYILPPDVQAVTESKDSEMTKLRNQLAEANLRLKDIEEENLKLGSLAKESGYRLYLESVLSGDPDAPLIRKLVGEVSQYVRASDLKEKVEALRGDLLKKREQIRSVQETSARVQAEAEALKQAESQRVQQRVDALKEENQKLRHALEQSLEASKLLKVRAYAESRMASHPYASKIRPIIENANVTSNDDVDALIEQFRPAVQDADQVDQVRARVRSKVGGAFSTQPIHEEAPPKRSRPSQDPFSDMGLSLEESRRLSGVGDVGLLSVSQTNGGRRH